MTNNLQSGFRCALRWSLAYKYGAKPEIQWPQRRGKPRRTSGGKAVKVLNYLDCRWSSSSILKPVGGDGDGPGDAEGNHVAKEPEFDRHF